MKTLSKEFFHALLVIIIIVSFVAVDLYLLNKKPSEVSAVVIPSFGITGGNPFSMIIDGDGNIYTSNQSSDNVSKITPEGVSSILGTTGSGPRGLVMDASGNIYVVNQNSADISKITPEGDSSIFSTLSSSAIDIVMDVDGNFYTANNGAFNVSKITSGGVETVIAATDANPVSITIDDVGNLYTANYNANNVSIISPDGLGGWTSTIIGTTGNSPGDILVDSDGNVFTVNSGGSNDVSMISPDGLGGWNSAIIASTGIDSFPHSIIMDEDGNLYTANNGTNNISIISPDGLGGWTSEIYASIPYAPLDLIIDEDGNMYISSFSNSITKVGNPTIVEVTPVITPISETANLNYTFNSDNVGTITYGGSCTSETTDAVVGNNNIIFNSLPVGTYSDCTIVVTDDFGPSNELLVSPFTVLSGLPSVTTLSATGLEEETTAILNGEITDVGDTDVTERGFEYGLNAGYGSTFSESTGPYGAGTFSAEIDSLTCGATYHYRAYAINSVGAGYGDDTTFTTTAKCPHSIASGGGLIGSNPPTPVPREIPDISKEDVIPVDKEIVKREEEDSSKEEPATKPSSPSTSTPSGSVELEEESIVPLPDVPNIDQSTEIVFENVSNFNTTSESVKITSSLLNDPAVKMLESTAVAVPAFVSIIAFFASVFSGMPFINLPIFLSGILPQLLRFKKRPKPWGTVYDSNTKKPLPFARVEVLNEQSRKLQTTIADANGRYGFLISNQISNVKLRAYLSGYNFPPKNEPSILEQKLYPNIYYGETINTLTGSANFDLPMEPKEKQVSRSFYFGISSIKLNNFLTLTADVVFALGATLGLINCLVNPNIFSFSVLALIILTFLLRNLGFRLKPFGLTKDQQTSQILPFSFVSLHKNSGERTNFTVSDDVGRYFLLTQKGNYLLKAFTPSYVLPTRTKEVLVSARKGWISEEIKI